MLAKLMELLGSDEKSFLDIPDYLFQTNEEASAYVSGWNDLREKVLALIAVEKTECQEGN